jgi:hypothetical protein
MLFGILTSASTLLFTITAFEQIYTYEMQRHLLTYMLQKLSALQAPRAKIADIYYYP